MAEERTVHIIGAGLAGLSAALQLSLMGQKVLIHESAPYAGGRCRSYFDKELDYRIDNGNHLVLSGNVAVQDYLELSGATGTMTRLAEPMFPFMDFETGERWTLRMNNGRAPRWIFDSSRRVPGTKPKDYLEILKLFWAGENDTVAQKIDTKSVLFRRLWNPLAISALNTELSAASARLLSNLLAQSLLAGGAACQPMIPKTGLSESFVLPCLDTIRKNGGAIQFGERLRGLTVTPEGQVTTLDFGAKQLQLGAADWVVLAVPAWVAQELIPTLATPTSFRSIANAHFRIEVPRNPAGFTGTVGGLAEWVFVRGGVVSVTVSAADRYGEHDNEEWVAAIWEDLAKLFDLDPQKVPPCRIVREKRATFAATPEQNRLRPTAYIGWKNLALAGDWTATSLPSTIEGAIRSGVKAAQVVMRWSVV